MKALGKIAALAAMAAASMPAAAQTSAVSTHEIAEIVESPPVPPAGASPTMMLPARDGTGRFVTINSNLAPAEAVWHVRAALNVAALACRGNFEAQTIANYNRLLREKAAALAEADSATRAAYRARYGAGWQDRHDGAMTRLYNFFAQPGGQAEFCLEAQATLIDAEAEAPERFAATAPEALSRLEAPFLAFYERYDRYRADVAAWDARRMAGVQVVAATTVVPPLVSGRGPTE